MSVYTVEAENTTWLCALDTVCIVHLCIAVALLSHKLCSLFGGACVEIRHHSICFVLVCVCHILARKFVWWCSKIE